MITDHTAAIFAALGITPETHPLLFYRYRSPTMENPETQKPISLINTAGHELRADGLAVRLWFIFKSKIANKNANWGMGCDSQWHLVQWGRSPVSNTSFAHAVHDALVEALGIGQ